MHKRTGTRSISATKTLLRAGQCLLTASTITIFGAWNTAQAGKTKRLVHEGKHQVDVAGVVGTPDGQYVVILKTQAEPARYLPIWIGEMEALNIRLRLERQRPPRPLTLNLLESVMQQSNTLVTEINIDDFRGGVFLGDLRLKRGKHTFKLDARPSDAIGLAVAGNAPIWVSEHVLKSAAVNSEQINNEDSMRRNTHNDTPLPFTHNEDRDAEAGTEQTL